MTLIDAIGAGVQSEFWRGGVQLAIMTGIGLYFFGPKILTEPREFDFTSQEGIDARVLVNAIGLGFTYLAGRAVFGGDASG